MTRNEHYLESDFGIPGQSLIQPDKSGSVRIFVAFPLSPETRSPFRLMAENTPPLAGLKWTPQDNLHLTLFFIGETPAENFPEIKFRLSGLFESIQPFQLSFDRVLLTGKISRSRMIWARFHHSDSFSFLHNLIHENVKPFMHHPPEFADPVPHITIARLKKGVDESAISLNFPEEFVLPPITCAEIWQTMREEKGVYYARTAHFEFGNSL